MKAAQPVGTAAQDLDLRDNTFGIKDGVETIFNATQTPHPRHRALPYRGLAASTRRHPALRDLNLGPPHESTLT